MTSWLLYSKARHGIGVRIIGLTGDAVRSFGGFLTVPDMSFHEALTCPFTGLALIGGTSWRTPEAESVKHLVLKAIDLETSVGAICDATTFLGRHDFLNNKRHTSNTLEDLKVWAGENYTNESQYVSEQAVADKGLVAANGTATFEFAALILKELYALPDEEIDRCYNFYKKGVMLARTINRNEKENGAFKCHVTFEGSILFCRVFIVKLV